MSRKFLLVLVLVVSAMGLLFWHQQALAQPCAPPSCYSRGPGRGYFTNVDWWGTGITRGPVFYGPGDTGLIGATNLATFLNLVSSALYVNLGAPGLCTNPATYAPVAGENQACNKAKHDAFGAAFIVDVMLDKNGSDFGTLDAGVAFAKAPANYGAWSALVSSYDASGWVQWTQSISIPNDGVDRLDSYGDDQPVAGITGGAQDTLFEFHDFGGITEDFIVFRNPVTGSEVNITKWCGNFALQVDALPPPAGGGASLSLAINGSPTDISVASGTPLFLTWTSAGIVANSCTASGTWSGAKADALAAPGENRSADGAAIGTYTLTYILTCRRTDNGQPIASTVRANISPGGGGASLSLEINGSPSDIAVSYGTPLFLTWTSSGIVANSCGASGTWSGAKADTRPSPGENRSSDDSVNGAYTLTYVLTCTRTDNGLPISSTIRAVVSPGGPPPIGNKPYFRVTNGDVAAGPGFYDASAIPTCSATATAPIAGFSSGAPNYLGAGSNLAAFDLGQVVEFTTGINLGVPFSKPKSLTFANINGSGLGAPASEYGGGFGSLDCMPDYYGTPGLLPTSGWYAAGSYVDGIYKTATDITLAAGTVPNGNHVTLYVNGNVYISGNITFGLGPWATTSDIPSFFLIVKGGNIFIDSSVTTLEGVYIAQPDLAASPPAPPGTYNAGKIYTCAVGGVFGPPSNADLVKTTGAGCGVSTLTVNGSFMARQIKLLRTTGDISTGPAEIFNYSPDVWVGAPAAPLVPTPTGYDSITNLPPVL